MTDFDHIDSEIDKIEQRIKMEYGDKYDNLEDSEKEDVILSHFFKGDKKYRESSRKLRLGLDAWRNDSEIEDNVKIIKITIRGKSRYQIRQKNGRFGKVVGYD